MPMEMASASVAATAACPGGGARTASAAVNCESSYVAAKAGGVAGQVKCSFTLPLPCAAGGTYTVTVVSKNGQSVSSGAQAFAYDASAAADGGGADSACALVADAFKTPDASYKAGVVTSGERPSGQLCASKSFTYTVKFGPYSKCGKYAAKNVASLTTGAPTVAASAVSVTPVAVVGCAAASVKTAANSAASCVAPLLFWKACMLKMGPKCLLGFDKLPGGLGALSAFTPAANARSTRTYADVLSAAGDAQRAPASTYNAAAAQYATAQLNKASGAAMPAGEVTSAYATLGKWLAASSGAGLSADQARAVQLYTAVLESYNAGTAAGAPKKCA
jgi:hypothetical protein